MSSNRIKQKPTQLKYLKSGYQREGDYKATVENIGICEVNGNHPMRTQEDAIVVDIPHITSDAFMALSIQDRALIAKTTFANLQEKLTHVAEADNCGSCACISTGQVLDAKDGKITARVSTSYVGDSVGFIVVLYAKGKLKSVTPCNPALHDGDNDAECIAIAQGLGRKKGIIIEDRLSAGPYDGLLAVTRAFGDNVYAEHGLLHTPQTTEVTVDLAADDRVFMVVTCDGAMEHFKGDNSVAKYAEELGALFENHHQLSHEALAEKIVDNALEKESMDNITAMVAPLILGKPAITVGVFDGHGGAYVSKHVSANFARVFQDNLDHLGSYG